MALMVELLSLELAGLTKPLSAYYYSHPFPTIRFHLVWSPPQLILIKMCRPSWVAMRAPTKNQIYFPYLTDVFFAWSYSFQTWKFKRQNSEFYEWPKLQLNFFLYIIQPILKANWKRNCIYNVYMLNSVTYSCSKWISLIICVVLGFKFLHFIINVGYINQPILKAN